MGQIEELEKLASEYAVIRIDFIEGRWRIYGYETVKDFEKGAWVDAIARDHLELAIKAMRSVEP